MFSTCLCAALCVAHASFGAKEGEVASLRELSPLERIHRMKAQRSAMMEMISSNESQGISSSDGKHIAPELQMLLARHKTKDNTIILSMTNAGEVDFALNMACSLKDVGAFAHLVVIATDQTANDVLQAQGVPVHFDPTIAQFVQASDTSNEAGNFGGKTWSLIAVQKLLMIAAVVGAEFNVFFTDVDVVFMRNPLPQLKCGDGHPHARFMWDGPSLNLSTGKNKEGVQPHLGAPLLFPHEVNGGFMYVCNNAHTVPMLADAANSFAEYWARGQCIWEWWCHDQYFVNQALSRAVAKQMTYQLFDKATWVNGWIMKSAMQYRMTPAVASGFATTSQISLRSISGEDLYASAVVVHVNWCSNKEQKISLLLKDRRHAEDWWKCGKCEMLKGPLGQLNASTNPLFDAKGNCLTLAQLQPYLNSVDVR